MLAMRSTNSNMKIDRRRYWAAKLHRRAADLYEAATKLDLKAYEVTYDLAVKTARRWSASALVATRRYAVAAFERVRFERISGNVQTADELEHSADYALTYAKHAAAARIKVKEAITRHRWAADYVDGRYKGTES